MQQSSKKAPSAPFVVDQTVKFCFSKQHWKWDRGANLIKVFQGLWPEFVAY